MPFRKIINALKRKTYGGFANEGIGNESCDGYPRQHHDHSIESQYTSCLDDANKLSGQVAELDQTIRTKMSRMAKIKSGAYEILCVHEDALGITAEILADAREILTSGRYLEDKYSSKMGIHEMVMNAIAPDLREIFGHDKTSYPPETIIRHQISKFEYKLGKIMDIVKDKRKAHIEICHSYEVMQASCLRHMEVMNDILRIITELTTMSREVIDQSDDAKLLNLRDDGSTIYSSEAKIVAIKRDLRIFKLEVDSILQEMSINRLVVGDADLNKPILSNPEREKVEEYLVSSRNVSIAPLDAAIEEAQEYTTTLANTRSERHAISEARDLINF